MGNPYAPPSREQSREQTGRSPDPEQAPPPRPPEQQQRRPPRPPPDHRLGHEAGRHVGRFALLMLAGLLSLQLPLPWQVAGLAFTVGGLVAGVLALRAVLRAGLRGAVIVSLAIALGMGTFMLLGQLALLAAWPATMRLQECRADALTVSAEDACVAEYERWFSEQSLVPSMESSGRHVPASGPSFG